MRSKLPTIVPTTFKKIGTCLVCHDYREECIVGYVEYKNLKGTFAKYVRKALTRDFYNEVAGSELTIVRYR